MSKSSAKPGRELDRRGVVGFGDGVRRRAHPLSETGERALYAVRDGVGRELRHFAKPLSEVRQMFRTGIAPNDIGTSHSFPCESNVTWCE